jgi:integrase
MARSRIRPRQSITNEFIIARREFDVTGLFPDKTVQGLYVRIGDKTVSWLVKKWTNTKGRRRSIDKALGHWPSMSPPAARVAALAVLGDFASGAPIVGKKDAVTFSAAFERYVEYLKTKAAKKGKPARWAYNVEHYGLIVLPIFGGWTLAEMAKQPGVIADWHAGQYKKTPASADHIARIIRAIYRREMKRDIHLPARLPTLAVDIEQYKPSQVALDFGDYPAWREAWQKIASPVERGYHLFCLLSGSRPGEAARMTRADIDADRGMFKITKAKGGKDINLPISPQIAFSLAMAVDAVDAGKVKPHHEVKQTDLLFPGCMQVSARAELPIRGQKLRHSYRAVCADLGVDALISHFLLGHAPKGISQEYIPMLILQNGPGMRAAQCRISKRMFELLGLTLEAHHDAPLAPSMPTAQKRKAAVPAELLDGQTRD